MKKCTKCKEEKKVEEFSNDKSKKDGKVIWCKLCMINYFNSNKHKNAQYRENNKEYTKQFYQNNKESILLSSKKYYENNREKKIEYSKEYAKEYYVNNKIKIKARNSKWFKDKKEKDPLYKLGYNMRCAFSRTFKTYLEGKFKKSKKSQQILGCTFEEFKLYLENKFEPWMSWNNYGLYNGEINYGWDIDHIIPLSSGKTEDDLYKLNHFLNLQPLCSKINRDIKKGKNINLE